MKRIIVALALVVLASGCTENIRARSFAGTATENLPKGQKLVNMTWKEANLWILTKPMTSTDVAETYTFKESSSFGVIQGTVIVVESK